METELEALARRYREAWDRIKADPEALAAFKAALREPPPVRLQKDESPYESVYEACRDAMIEYGPDGHCDGADKIADAVMRAYDLWKDARVVSYG